MGLGPVALHLQSHHGQVDGPQLLSPTLTLEPTGPSLLVFGDALNKAEERGYHPMTVIQKNPLRPVKEKQSVLPRTFRQLWDPQQMNNCGSWTFL